MIQKLLAYFGGAGGYVIAGRVLQLLMFLSVARATSIETMGIFISSLTAGQLISTFSTFGLGAASQKIIPANQARGRHDRILDFLRGFILALVVMTIVIVVVIVLLGRLGSAIGLQLDPKDIAGLLIFVPIVAVSINRELLARAFGAIGLAFVPRDILWSGAMIACVLVIPIEGVSILWISGGLLLAIETVAVAILVWRFVLPLRHKARGKSYLRFRKSWVRDGLAFIASSLGGQGFERIDTLYVASAFSIGMAGVYGLCSRIAPITSLCQRFIVPVLLRRFSSDLALRKMSSVRQDLLLGVAAATIFCSPVLLGVLLFGEHLLALFGPEYVEGKPVLIALTLAHTAIALGSNFGALILSSERPHLYGKVILATAGVTLVLLLTLQPESTSGVAWLISAGIVTYNIFLTVFSLALLRSKSRAKPV